MSWDFISGRICLKVAIEAGRGECESDNSQDSAVAIVSV